MQSPNKLFFCKIFQIFLCFLKIAFRVFVCDRGEIPTVPVRGIEIPEIKNLDGIPGKFFLQLFRLFFQLFEILIKI
jgi:hypothetical protein